VTGQYTDAVVASATALAARHRVAGTLDLDSLIPGERTWWLRSAHTTLKAGLDLDRMTEAYGVAQYGRRAWEAAPAVIRNDVRERMAAVVASILGDPDAPAPNVY
jgi:hypothetical protein